MTARIGIRLAAIVMLCMGVAGCETVTGVFKNKEVPIENRSAREIYDMAQAQMVGNNPEAAAKLFNDVERLYPFSELAKRAIIMSAWAYYQANQGPKARASAKRYLDLYPSDKDAPYAQHIIARTHYDRIVDVGRDQATTRSALRELREVMRRYPDSDFAKDASLKIDLALNHLAGKEMTVGRYYLKRGHFQAAANRFKIVIEQYGTTSHVAEALHRLVECFLSLGLESEAQNAAAVLGENFIGSDWYAASYALLKGRDLRPKRNQGGLFERVYRQVIKGKWL